MNKRRLLKTLPECVHPAEFQVTRLLGRKASLSCNWDLLIASTDVVEILRNSPFYSYLEQYGNPGVWCFLRHEYLWIYQGMNNTLRNWFESYFVYHEANTLITCLRCLSQSMDEERVSQDLHHSLLHNDIQQILTSGLDFFAMLQTLELYLSSLSHHFSGFVKRYETKGMAGLEILLRDAFFGYLTERKQPSLLQVFLQFLIDYHNCLGLAKTLRWQLVEEHQLIPGGTVATARFKRAYNSKDMAPVLRFLRMEDVQGAYPALLRLETALLRRISTTLKSWSRQRTVVGDILFYLWDQYRNCRNLSMLLNTILLDDESVRDGIV